MKMEEDAGERAIRGGGMKDRMRRTSRGGRPGGKGGVIRRYVAFQVER